MAEISHPYALWEQSAPAWIAFLEVEAQRKVLLDPLMLSLAQTAPGRKALDMGCGEGRFCRLLQEDGFETMGLDPTQPFIDAAKAKDPTGTYLRGSGEELPFANESFDLVVSYLTLIDIPDYRKAIDEMARVAKPGGLILVANLTSMSTGNPKMAWDKDADGNKLAWTIDDYAIERGVLVSWAGITIINYHRPLSAYMQAYLANGLRLEAFHEPTPTAEQAAERPDLKDHFRLTNFNIMAWRKE